MKATALILLSIASVAGLAGIATANPFTGREAQSEGFGNLGRGLEIEFDSNEGRPERDAARGQGRQAREGLART